MTENKKKRNLVYRFADYQRVCKEKLVENKRICKTCAIPLMEKKQKSLKLYDEGNRCSAHKNMLVVDERRKIVAMSVFSQRKRKKKGQGLAQRPKRYDSFDGNILKTIGLKFCLSKGLLQELSVEDLDEIRTMSNGKKPTGTKAKEKKYLALSIKNTSFWKRQVKKE